MQTLYSYKGNTPIIAQYGVHELLGSHVDGNKTKEINHREIAIAIERPQSNAAGSAQGLFKRGTTRRRTGMVCMQNGRAREEENNPRPLSVRLVGLFIRCPCVLLVPCLFLLGRAALHEALALVAFAADTVDGVHTLLL